MYIDWRGITQDAVTSTNYQLLPGDRIYVKADPLIATDSLIAKITVPMSRILGVTLLGNGAVRSLWYGTPPGSGANNGLGFF